jgi:ketosteroid isomerase-like protein
MLCEKLRTAWSKGDLDGYKSVHHDDYHFVRHSTGETMKRTDMTDDQMKFMMENFKSEKERCIYEDDKVLVEHSHTTFPDGTKEAVMAVHMKKDGLLWRTETGATPLK